MLAAGSHVNTATGHDTYFQSFLDWKFVYNGRANVKKSIQQDFNKLIGNVNLLRFHFSNVII